MDAREPQALSWRKSTYSTDNGDCVELAWRAPTPLVRDSKAPAHGTLTVRPAQWRTFLTALR